MKFVPDGNLRNSNPILTPTTDLPLLRKARGVAVERFDEFGSVGRDALQHVASPFDNVKLRRALRR